MVLEEKIEEIAMTLAEDVYDGRIPPWKGDVPYKEFPREEGRYSLRDDIEGELMEIRAYPEEEKFSAVELP